MNLFTLCAAPCLLAAALVCQDASSPPSFDTRVMVGVGHDALGMPWAMGPDYKATFVDGALQFVPALGHGAPVNRSLAFRLRSIARGAAELAAQAPVSVQVRQDAHRLEVARGDVVECYEARPDGLEQSFVFATRPPGEGDLVVRGEVTTTLRGGAAPAGRLHFVDATGAGVTIGGVVGIDADGRRCPGVLQFTDGVLELRLPAGFVDGARFPLVLDPLFGTATGFGGTSFDDEEVDVAHEGSTDTWLVVWSRTFSSADRDVRAQRVGGNGALLGGLLAIASAGDLQHAPAVAAVEGRNRFVVCWQEGPSILGPYDVNARTVDAATGALAAAVGIGIGTTNDVLPAVTGSRSPFVSSALIAWQSAASGLLTRSVTVSTVGVLTPGTTHVVSPQVGLTAPPELQKTRGLGGVSLISWSAGPVFQSVRAQAIDQDGAPLGTFASIDTLVPSYQHGMDGDGSQWLVVHGTGSEVKARSITWNGNALVLGASTTLVGIAGTDGFEVAWLGDRYLAVWQQPTAVPFDYEVRGVAVKPDCTLCGLPFLVGSVARPGQRGPAVAPVFTTSGPTGDALLAWNETEITPPFVGSVVGQRFRAMVGAPPVVLGPSCPGGGTASMSGPFVLGNQGFRFTVSGADPTAPFALLALADGNTTPVSCGCTFTQSLVLYAVAANLGTAEFPFPLQCNPLLLGFQLEYQWIMLGGTTSPCPVLPLTGSERVLLTVAE